MRGTRTVPGSSTQTCWFVETHSPRTYVHGMWLVQKALPRPEHHHRSSPLLFHGFQFPVNPSWKTYGRAGCGSASIQYPSHGGLRIAEKRVVSDVRSSACLLTRPTCTDNQPSWPSTDFRDHWCRELGRASWFYYYQTIAMLVPHTAVVLASHQW